MSTSLPIEVQYAFIRTVPGLENAELMRPGYAVEYDYCPPTQLRHTLETKLVPGLYLAHEREVFRRDGMLYAHSDFTELLPGEEPFTASVRYRTVGDMTCTGAVASDADTLEDVVAEIAATAITERGETRADDRVTEAAMEDRKKEGYF